MSRIDPDTVVVVTFWVALVAPIVFRPRPLVALTVCALVTFIGWITLLAAVHAAVPVIQQQLAADAKARGEPLSLEDAMYDGVGDRVATLMIGWMPGVAGTCVGAILGFLTRRPPRRERRAVTATTVYGFPVKVQSGCRS